MASCWTLAPTGCLRALVVWAPHGMLSTCAKTTILAGVEAGLPRRASTALYRAAVLAPCARCGVVWLSPMPAEQEPRTVTKLTQCLTADRETKYGSYLVWDSGTGFRFKGAHHLAFWAAADKPKGPTCIHLVADHFSPLVVGQLPCRLWSSVCPSGVKLHITQAWGHVFSGSLWCAPALGSTY